MKKLINYAVVLAAMIAGHSVYAQRVMNDPSYSVNNYKHPNKAAYMKKQQDKQPVVYLEEVKDEEEKTENNFTASANYKGMSASKAKRKTFRVTNAPSFNTAFVPAGNGNYKQQSPATQRKPKTESNKDTKETPIVRNN